MRARQRKSGVVVVERRSRPRCSAMAVLASLRESCLHVIGVACALEILQVTRDACGVGDAVIIVNVALRTLQRRVCSGQGKSRGAVIKSRVCP